MSIDGLFFRTIYTNLCLCFYENDARRSASYLYYDLRLTSNWYIFVYQLSVNILLLFNFSTIRIGHTCGEDATFFLDVDTVSIFFFFFILRYSFVYLS